MVIHGVGIREKSSCVVFFSVFPGVPAKKIYVLFVRSVYHAILCHTTSYYRLHNTTQHAKLYLTLEPMCRSADIQNVIDRQMHA